MAIAASDLLIKMSVKTGSAGDSTSSTVAGSLGKYVSTTQVSTTPLNNFFDDVSAAENVASTVDYRCYFLHNNHATLTYYGAVVYLSAETAGGASMSIAVDNIAASAKGSSSAQADQIINETTAPTGVGAFSSPVTVGSGLALGDLAPGQVRAVWLKRTASNSGAVDLDGFTIAFAGDSAA
mgnify:CR=1 FL=1